MQKAIYADKFFFEHEVSGPGYLVLTDGTFDGFYETLPTSHFDVIDYTGKWIAPGLVDTHVHGLLGHDVMDNDVHGLEKISEGLLACGVTSFLPTTLTASIESLNEVVKTIGSCYQNVSGAKIQGIFLEGPFFAEAYKGAQNSAYFSDPSIEALQKWQELSRGLIKKVAVAPELQGANEFIKYATESGVSVALAHSGATYKEAKAAADHGASMFVHTFNGMTPLHHREPGMVGAAMSLNGVYNELICDGYHVHPQVVKLLIRATDVDRTVLISDSMRAGLMPEGTYELGEFPVTVKGKTACLENGSLAGSVLLLKDAVKNLVDWEIATPFEAIRMASLVPAKSLAMDHMCGKIASGHDADFIVLDRHLGLLATYVNGEKKYERPPNKKKIMV